MSREKKYALVNSRGEFYAFWNRNVYGEPTFSKDRRLAKLMTAQGCASAMRMLKDPVRWGESVSRVDMTSDSHSSP